MRKINFICHCLCLLVSACLSVEAAEQNMISNTQSTMCTADVNVFKAFDKITFFLYVPYETADLNKEIENLAVRELKKIGSVDTIHFSMKSLEEKGILKNPFLIYKLSSIQDVDGKDLSIMRASLIFKAPITIDKNKLYSQSVLWQCELYLQKDQDLKKMISRTLTPFMEEFKKMFSEANENKPIKPVFYFAK